VTKELPQKLYNKYNGRHINSGGGSSIFYFENKDDCKNFSKDYSKFVLETFPSLEFFMASLEYDPRKILLLIKLKNYMKNLKRKSQKRYVFLYS